ncbi:MAG: c-type cytochrome, partial [Candidatus Eremiobacteraeota bacterium]|nr:c-type cytochrome [Candidatus Eremiobacteraeota bacterium]
MAKSLTLLFFAVCGITILSACSGNKPTTSTSTGPPNASASAGGMKQTAGGDATHGRTIFMQNCSSCHGANATGGVGPSLKNESARKNFAQAIAWIKNPQPP